MLFNIDDKDLEQYKKNLDNAGKYAFPDTCRATLTKEAFETSKEYKKNIRQELTIRGGKSNIVLNSVHYEKAQYNEKDVDKMVSYVGQQSETYGKKTEQLRIQEFGETITSKTSHIAKATKYTRGGNFKRFVPKARLMSRTNAKRIDDIAKNPVKGDTTAQFRQAIAIVHRTHKTINFIPDKETTRHKFGIFELKDSGTVIRDGKPHAKGKSAKLLYSFKNKTQPLHARPMLKPASDKIAPKCGKYFEYEAERRLSKEMTKGLKA